MPSEKIKTIHLLILEPSSNKAEVIINALRNNGYAVRATQILNAEDLAAALEKGVSDLLLANFEYKELSAKQAIEQIATFGRDIPCIVMTKTYDEKALVEIMQYGAKDAVEQDSLPLMCLKIKRELDSLESRRQRTQTDLALKATEKRCTLLLSNSQDAIAYVHQGMHVYANNAYLELFDYEDHDELMCVPVLDMIAKDSQTEFRQYLKEMSATSEQKSFSFCGMKSDMQQFDAIMTLSTASYDDEICTQLLIRAAVDNSELEEKLKELTSMDTMTGLYNKTYFNELLQKAIESANEKGKTYNLIYIRYDQHAKILSEYGIAGVDQITQDCAKWLSEQLPEETSLAKIADDSFGFIQQGNSSQQIKQLCDQLCKNIAGHLFDIQGITVQLSFSIGVCPIGDSSRDAAQSLSDAITTADRVEGGNGYKIYSQAIHSAAKGVDVKILEQVQESVDSGKAHLMYQPIIKLHGEMRPLYAVTMQLIDNNDNEMDFVTAIAAVKAAGLAGKLDRWVVKQAIKAIKTNKIDKQTQLFICLSGGTLIDESFTGFIEKAVASTGIAKSNLVFQIEEADAINHLKRVITLSSELKKRGYVLCLSNFGEMSKDMALLEQVECDYVKLADSKVADLYQDPEVMEEAQKLLTEIHNRDKLSIIPKVEEAAMLAALWPMDVKYIQGFYLQAPGKNMNYDFSSSGF